MVLLVSGQKMTWLQAFTVPKFRDLGLILSLTGTDVGVAVGVAVAEAAVAVAVGVAEVAVAVAVAVEVGVTVAVDGFEPAPLTVNPDHCYGVIVPVSVPVSCAKLPICPVPVPEKR